MKKLPLEQLCHMEVLIYKFINPSKDCCVNVVDTCRQSDCADTTPLFHLSQIMSPSPLDIASSILISHG